MSAPFRLAIVGAGAIAQAHAAAVEAAGCRLVAVADVRRDAAERLAAPAGAATFGSVGEMLASGVAVGAAVVATPPDSHESVAVALATAGIHVLVEKPFALCSGSAGRILAAAESAGVLVTMAAKFRHTADFAAAEKLIDSGELGEILSADVVFTGVANMHGRWNADPKASGGGVLADNGPHAFDLLRGLVGSLDRVVHVRASRVAGMGVEEEARVFATAGPARSAVSVELAWSYHRDCAWYLSLVGSAGQLELGWKQSRFKRHAEPTWTVIGPGYDKHAAFAAQLANFAAASRKQAEPRVTPADALASVEAVEMAYEVLMHS